MRTLIALVVICLGSAACGGGDTHSITQGQSGSRLTVATGDVIEVTLESNPSTGYEWSLVLVPEMIELTGDEFVAPDTDLVGAPGTHRFTFEALGEGAGIVRLEYVRPFDDPPVPDRVAEYIIVVGDAVWPPEDAGTTPPTSTATAVIDVGDLADQNPGNVRVRGFVIWDQSSARLCEVLLESYPPQCGGDVIEIANPEALTLDLEEAQSVRWTAGAVTLVGFFDGERLRLDA